MISTIPIAKKLSVQLEEEEYQRGQKNVREVRNGGANGVKLVP